MLKYINTVMLSTVSVNEVLPISITIKDLTEVGDSVLVSLVRFDTANETDQGVSIAAHGLVTGQTLTLSNIWNDGETPAAGKYRLRGIAQSSDGSRRIEVNAFLSIIRT